MSYLVHKGEFHFFQDHKGAVFVGTSSSQEPSSAADALPDPGSSQMSTRRGFRGRRVPTKALRGLPVAVGRLGFRRTHADRKHGAIRRVANAAARGIKPRHSEQTVRHEVIHTDCAVIAGGDDLIADRVGRETMDFAAAVPRTEEQASMESRARNKKKKTLKEGRTRKTTSG